MLIVRNLRQGRFEFKVEEDKQTIKVTIEKFLIEFSKGLLRKIFSQHLERNNYEILEANVLYVDFVHTGNGIFWNFIFLREEGNDGIFLGESEKWFFRYDFYEYITDYEFEKGRVIYAFSVTPEDFFPLNKNSINKLVEEYFN